MKRCFLLSFLVIFASTAIAQNQFVLTGDIKHAQTKYVFLKYSNNEGIEVYDSCLLQAGRFTFKGNISEPTLAHIRTNSKIIPDDENKNITRIFLEPVKMTAALVHDRFVDMKLTGSKTHDEFDEKEKKHRLINATYKDSLFERHFRLIEEYIFNHRDSYVSVHDLNFYKGNWDPNSLRYLFARLDPKLRETSYGKDIKAFLDGLEANSEGSRAHEFMAKEEKGKNLKLSDFRGKYVLLDFWGSWCGPCRESNPHLIGLFNKYAAKGFTVVAIATEYEKTDTKWREAIEKDGTGIWHNVLSNPYPASDKEYSKDISGMFSVHVYPTKLLIDPCGHIIGRFKGTEEDEKLDEQLKAIFE